MQSEIPSTWLGGWTDLSWFPSVCVARRDQQIVLKASRSGYLVALILLSLAAGVWFGGMFTTIPQWFLAIIVAMLAFGALLSPIAVAVFVRLSATRLTIDPQAQIVELLSNSHVCELSFKDILAIQYLTKPNAAQINLAYRTDDASVTRTCLYGHANAKYVLALARDFTSLVPWPVIDADGHPVR